jgi:hypothetical protein
MALETAIDVPVKGKTEPAEITWILAGSSL